MKIMILDPQDRVLFVETFCSGKDAYSQGVKRENNPYKQGTVSHAGWDEGWEYESFGR